MTDLRIGIGGIRYETNSFSPGRAHLDAFQSFYVREAEDVLAAEPNTEVFGASQASAELGVRLVGLFDTWGGCGPAVDHDVYLGLRDRFLSSLRERVDELDAVVLVLHGAMTTTRESDVEGDLATHVRQILGPHRPLAVTHDLHGAPTDRLCSAADALVAFKTCPHVDYEETGARALALAAAAARGTSRPRILRTRIPMLTPSEGHDTIDGPMAALQHAIQEDARRMGLLDESVLMCQPWLDTPRTAWHITCTFDELTTSATAVEKLMTAHADQLWSARARLAVTKTSVADAVADAMAAPDGAPVLLADGGDSPSAGSCGDSTDLLRAILDFPEHRPVLTIVTDAPAARLLHHAGVGAQVDVRLGNTRTNFTDPIEVRGTVTQIGDGNFMATYPAGPASVGETAVLQAESTTIVVTSRPAMMLDQSIYRHLDIDPEDFHAVQVKSAGGFRALWSDISSRIIYVDSRGASDSSLTLLPFGSVPTDVWPLHAQTSPETKK